MNTDLLARVLGAAFGALFVAVYVTSIRAHLAKRRWVFDVLVACGLVTALFALIRGKR